MIFIPERAREWKKRGWKSHFYFMQMVIWFSKPTFGAIYKDILLLKQTHLVKNTVNNKHQFLKGSDRRRMSSSNNSALEIHRLSCLKITLGVYPGRIPRTNIVQEHWPPPGIEDFENACEDNSHQKGDSTDTTPQQSKLKTAEPNENPSREPDKIKDPG